MFANGANVTVTIAKSMTAPIAILRSAELAGIVATTIGKDSF
jgi:hypothetical protein